MIYTPGTNPALALYNFWLTMLTQTSFEDGLKANDTFAWGPHGWALGRGVNDGQGRPTLGFGQRSRSGYFYTYFHLAADGRFQFADMHGQYRRAQIARMTFLNWSWTHGRYQWFVDTSPPNRHFWADKPSLTDWRKPLHYVSEDLIGCRVWRQTRRYLVLEPNGTGGWKIMPARSQIAPEYTVSDDEIIEGADPVADAARAHWERYDKIRARRYLKAENAWRVAHNLPAKVSARPARVRDNGRLLSGEEAVEQLIALLDVTTPASIITSTPRPKEAPNGDNLVTTHAV